MRISSSMYYQNLFGSNNSKINKELFDVNKQISSGLSIQYAHEDVRTFSETMRLDNEVTTLKQIETSVESGYKTSNQTDTVLNEFTDNMRRMRTLLIQASNDTQNESSRAGIAKELRGLEKNLKLLANTSINGKFIFSGSAVDVKPIDENGLYHGNDGARSAFMGSQTTQQYNISGQELFLGEKGSIKKEQTTNVRNTNLLTNGSLSPSSTLNELMGDKDNDDTTVNTNYFYLRGVKSDGEAVHKKIVLNSTQTIDNLLDEIGKAYGNSGSQSLVNVSLNDAGEIVITDKQRGSSKLDFHLVGAVDFDTTTDENGDGNNDDADVDTINLLDGGENDYQKIKDGTATSNLFVKEFVVSDLAPANKAPSNINGLVYDRTYFKQDGSKLFSNMSQILKSDNSFATPATKISDVADLSQGTAGTLDGTVFNLEGKDINGNAYTATINFKSTANGGSTFSVDSDGDGVTDTDYTIFNMQNPRTAADADDVRYQQLMDVMNMVITNTLPATSPGTAAEYDSAISDAATKASVSLDYKGSLEFQDFNAKSTQASISLYDANSGDFSTNSSTSVLSFNTNSSLTIRDAKTDFFKTLDTIIQAVEDNTLYPDSTKNTTTVGMENALQMLDDLSDHVSKMHSQVGAYSNTLSTSLERTQTLEITTQSLRSSIVDTDLADASLRLQQLSVNYQALLSSVGKVSKLSLVNYL